MEKAPPNFRLQYSLQYHCIATSGVKRHLADFCKNCINNSRRDLRSADDLTCQEVADTNLLGPCVLSCDGLAMVMCLVVLGWSWLVLCWCSAEMSSGYNKCNTLPDIEKTEKRNHQQRTFENYQMSLCSCCQFSKWLCFVFNYFLCCQFALWVILC